MDISKEDYLAEIYQLQFCNNRATRITEIALALKVSKPSVSEMVRKLAGEGLVYFERYGGVTLTKKGIIEARKVVRKHQLLEVFFKKVLKIKNKFHMEAHKVEHGLSEEATDNLEKVLKSPNICPDGNPIPSKNKDIITLNELPLKTNAIVLFSNARDRGTAQRLNSLGIVPSTKLHIIRRIARGPLIMLIKGSEVALGSDICSQIFVEKK
jgi:DtxR family Mn-dependent transcriptional regulator